MVNQLDHYVYFGDGTAAMIIDTREYIKKKTGLRMIKFILKPSKDIERIYDIKEDQDLNGFIVKEYPTTDVVFLVRGVNKTRCWVYTDFLGGSTPASRRFEELTMAIADSERLYRSAMAAKNRAFYELEIERQFKKKAIKDSVEILREVARARGRVDGEEGMGYDSESELPQ